MSNKMSIASYYCHYTLNISNIELIKNVLVQKLSATEKCGNVWFNMRTAKMLQEISQGRLRKLRMGVTEKYFFLLPHDIKNKTVN